MDGLASSESGEHGDHALDSVSDPEEVDGDAGGLFGEGSEDELE